MEQVYWQKTYNFHRLLLLSQENTLIRARKQDHNFYRNLLQSLLLSLRANHPKQQGQSSQIAFSLQDHREFQMLIFIRIQLEITFLYTLEKSIIIYITAGCFFIGMMFQYSFPIFLENQFTNRWNKKYKLILFGQSLLYI